MAIPQKHLDTVCKRGQGEECCRYLCIDSSGWTCAKLTTLKTMLDNRVVSGAIRSKGDNCEGLSQTSETN